MDGLGRAFTWRVSGGREHFFYNSRLLLEASIDKWCWANSGARGIGLALVKAFFPEEVRRMLFYASLFHRGYRRTRLLN